MTYYTCEHTLEAMLSCIYDAWCSKRGHQNIELLLEPIDQYTLFDEYIHVDADHDIAVSVMEAVKNKISYHVYQELSDGWSILVVSDGAGSAKYAGRGSKANCTISIKLLSEMIAKNKWIENSILPSELDWHIEFRTICERMKQIYQNKVEEMNDGSVLTDFNATLLICVITPNGMLSGHIGDGRMGYYSVNGEWQNLMIPDKGEEGNQTLFLQSSWNKPHVPALKVSNVYVPETRVIRDIPKAVVLISDGCERSCWECSIFDTNIGKYTDVNSPHPGFMEPLIESIIAEEDSNRFNLFVDIIDKGTKACQTERDDKTMLIVMSKINHGISNI